MTREWGGIKWIRSLHSRLLHGIPALHAERYQRFFFFLPLFRFLLKLVQEPQESRRTQQHHIKDSSDSRQLQSLCKAENTKSEELLGGENKVINRLTVAKRFLRSVCVCVCVTRLCACFSQTDWGTSSSDCKEHGLITLPPWQLFFCATLIIIPGIVQIRMPSNEIKFHFSNGGESLHLLNGIVPALLTQCAWHNPAQSLGDPITL